MMKQDIKKVVIGLILVTVIAPITGGIYGGLAYLVDRHNLVTENDLQRYRVTSYEGLKIEPLTKSEIELIERLKESVEMDQGSVKKYDSIMDVELDE